MSGVTVEADQANGQEGGRGGIEEGGSVSVRETYVVTVMEVNLGV